MARMEFEHAQGAVGRPRARSRPPARWPTTSVVRAPFAGRVVDTLVEVGDLAAPGRPLVRVRVDRRAADLARRSRGGHRSAQPGAAARVTHRRRPDLGTIEGHGRRDRAVRRPRDPHLHGQGRAARGRAAFRPRGRARIPGDDGGQAGGAGVRGPPPGRPRAGGGPRRGRHRPDPRGDHRRGRSTDDRIEILSGPRRRASMVAVDAPGPVADGTPVEVAR